MKIHGSLGFVFFIFVALLVACTGNHHTSSATSSTGSPAGANAASTAIPSVEPTPPFADGDPVGPRRYSNMQSPRADIPITQSKPIPQSCMDNSDQCTWTVYLQTRETSESSPTPEACSSEYCLQIAALMTRDEVSNFGIIPGTTEQYNLAMTVSAQPGVAKLPVAASRERVESKKRGDPIRHRRYTNMTGGPATGASPRASVHGIPVQCMTDSTQCTWTIHFQTSKKKKRPLHCTVDQCFAINTFMQRTELPYPGYDPKPAYFWLRMTISAQTGKPAPAKTP